MASVPLLCFLIALPFASATAIALVPELQELAARRPQVTWPVGAVGLALLLAGLLGAFPHPIALPLTVLGGAVSGFSVFWPAPEESDDPDEPRLTTPDPTPDPTPDHTPDPAGPDWGDFDRLRAEWERDTPTITPMG